MNKYLFFYVLDHTLSQTTTGYTLPITPFTFVPVLDVGTSDVVSTTKLKWDFGDGTTSRDITAVHAYSIPGTYNVTCYLYSTGGTGYESSFTQNIFVRDYITDAIAISASDVTIIEVGHYQNPFTVLRQNSWQTYPSLSSTGSTIQLYASGTGAPLYNAAAYNSDKYAHLRSTSRFLAYEYNSNTAMDELVVVDRVKTQHNADIYVKLDSGYNIVPCNMSDDGSTLAGTSGMRVVYFTDDIVKPPLSGSLLPNPVVTIAYFDSTQLVDNDSYRLSIAQSEYPVLHQVVSNWYIPTFIDQSNIDHLTITSNGIDGEGYVDTSFEIAPDKFVGQRIPLIARVKDAQNYTSKTSSLLTLIPQTATLTANSIKMYLLSSDDTNITEGITFKDNFGEFQGQTTGGFFKGYLSATAPYENVHIYAVAQLSGLEYYILPTPYAIVAQPQSNKLHKIDIEHNSGDFSISTYTEHLFTTSLTGVYSLGIFPSTTTNTGAVDYFVWVADADNDLLSKYDINGVLKLQTSLPIGSSPSCLSIDKDGDVWVSLYDSVSTLKIDAMDGHVHATAVPSLSNVDWTDPSYYEMLSGHAGSNSITPASIDTDRDNNLWVAYNHPLSSFVCKYTTSGSVVSTFMMPVGYYPTEIISTNDRGVWIINKHDDHVLNSLSSADVLYNITHTGIIHTIDLSATLWNITMDVEGNIWSTADKNSIIKYNTQTSTATKFAMPSSADTTPSSDLAGIGCTTSNAIMVVNSHLKCVHAFNVVDAADDGSIVGLSSISLSAVDFQGNPIQDNINAVGDWTGFKCINKFFKHNGFVEMIEGISSTFNIYPSSGKYSIGKKNENFDAKSQYKSYTFQEPYQDYNKLFTDFMGTAVGDASATPNTLGKKMYEKTANFVGNLVDVDTCNIDALKSMHEMLNENFYNLQSNSLNYYPANIARLIDMLSIKFTKLRGDRNMYAENFDDKGFYNSVDPSGSTVKYGRNKGTQLDVMTSTLTAGVDGQLVVYEKFSGMFSTVNTNLLTATYIDGANKIYALSSYDETWGWGLVLPEVYQSTDLSKYYAFFNYTSGGDMTQLAGVINWNDAYTTVMENISSAQSWNNIMENMLTYTMAEGLNVVPTPKY